MTDAQFQWVEQSLLALHAKFDKLAELHSLEKRHVDSIEASVANRLARIEDRLNRLEGAA